MRNQAISLAILLLCSQWVYADDRPNVLLVLLDDMGYGDIGANGAQSIATPNIDTLAASGANFSNFYASANVCTPSRAGLLTGLYPIRTGLAHGVVEAKGDDRGLPKDIENIAKLLKREDYATKMVGKWHLGNFPKYHPLDYGFDEFYGVPFSNDMAGFQIYDGRQAIAGDVDQALLSESFTDQAIDFIAQKRDKPFFLFLSHSMPHIPLFASEKFKGRSQAGLYGDVIEELDWNMGRLIKALKQQGLYENTLIIFTSDNGPFFEGSVAGLKGGKGSSYDGGFRVPLIISWPNKISSAQRVDSVSMNIDVLPTVADAVGRDKTADFDGLSLLPILNGEDAQREYLYLFNNEDVIAVRSQRWKYLIQTYYRTSIGDFSKFGQLPGFKSPYDLLFDMQAPTGERYSLADRFPQVLERHRAELIAAGQKFDGLRTRPKARTFPQ
ncbi:MAG: sulfatase [Cellvibrionaceae bacterium]|nr:sulfatase [Cellvibrionaceae bacterium]